MESCRITRNEFRRQHVLLRFSAVARRTTATYVGLLDAEIRRAAPPGRDVGLNDIEGGGEGGERERRADVMAKM